MYEDDYKSISEEEKESLVSTEQVSLKIEPDTLEEPISETIALEASIEKSNRPAMKWLMGIAVSSLCAGLGIGVGFSFVAPLQTAYYKKLIESEKVDLESNDEAIVVMGSQNAQRTYDQGALPPESDHSIVDIAKKVGPSIVSVYNNKKLTAEESFFYFNNSDEMVTGLGSGILFEEDSNYYYIMTNSHVVEGANTLAINLLGGIKTEAKLVGKDQVNDIAVIKVDKKVLPDEIESLKMAPLGDSDAIEVGQLAIAIGTPATEALNNTVTTGILSAVERNITISGNRMKVIQTDAAINPGNSGGALVGPTGEIIGMNVAKTVNTEGIGFSIPINHVKEVVADLMENGSVIRPGLGITGIAVSDAHAALYELPIGIYIQTVIKGGSADLVGIKANDVLIQFDGQMITTMEQLKSLIAQKRVGDLVEVKVIRDGEQKRFKMELKEMPES